MAFSLALGVTPELLKAKSSEVSADIDGMKAALETIRSEMEGTRDYWKGDAGEQHRRKFEDHLEEINQLVQRLYTYPERILRMAGIYEEAESFNAALAESLATDIEMR